MKRIYFVLYILVLLSCNQTSAENDSLFPIRSGFKYGFIDEMGSIVIPLNYTYADSFSEGLAAITTDKDFKKNGFINLNGEIEIKPIYQSVKSFSNGLAAVKINNLWGFINKEGSVVIDFQFDDASSFSDELAVVATGDKYGFIDKTGKIVVPLQYDTAWSFSEGLAGVGIARGKGQKGFKFGYIDKSNNLVIDMIYGHAGDFTNGYAVVTLIDGPFQLIDKTGKDVLSDIKHGGVREYTEGLLPIYYNGAYCYMTIDKEVIIEPQFKSVTSFSEGRAFVSFDRMTWGVIDKKGKMICEPRFKSISPFQNGLAKVQIDTDPRPPVTYINLDGEIIWPKNIQ